MSSGLVRIILCSRYKLESTESDNWINTVTNILESKAWGKEYSIYTKIKKDDLRPEDIILYLSTRTFKDELMKGISGRYNPSIPLSWTWHAHHPQPALIIIDEENWNDSHKNLGITQENYRSYVIWHELGHAHGIEEHQELPSIMAQLTIATPKQIKELPEPLTFKPTKEDLERLPK